MKDTSSERLGLAVFGPRTVVSPYLSTEGPMQRLRACLAVVTLVSSALLLPATTRAQAEKKADVTGKWLFTVNTDAGSGTRTVTFKQTGDSLTGHYSSQTFGEVDFKGTIKDQKIVFRMNVDAQGTAIPVTYSGTWDGADA